MPRIAPATSPLTMPRMNHPNAKDSRIDLGIEIARGLAAAWSSETIGKPEIEIFVSLGETTGAI